MRTILLALLLLFVSCVGAIPTGPELPGASEYSDELWLVCWNPDGSAGWPHACAHPEPLVWEALPIPVLSDAQNEWALAAAVEVWNSWLGTHVFRVTDDPEEARVFVLSGGPHDSWRGVTYMFKRDDQLLGLVQIFDGALYDEETMTHELGHVLGLDHDPDWRRSIMYPNDARVFPTLEYKDWLVLRKLYKLG